MGGAFNVLVGNFRSHFFFWVLIARKKKLNSSTLVNDLWLQCGRAVQNSNSLEVINSLLYNLGCKLNLVQWSRWH